MKSLEFLSKINRDVFNLPYDRLMKHGTMLRRLGLFPDGRARESHVTAVHAVHAMRVLATNHNPLDKDYELRALDFSQDPEALYELSDLIENGGENLYTIGVHRVSFSLDRAQALIVYNEPSIQEMVQGKWECIKLKEKEIAFGDSGARGFERYAHVKRSALMAIANALCMEEQGEELKHTNKQ